MFKRNDGKGANAVQNRFTALLKKSLHNHKVDYIIAKNNRIYRELPMENDTSQIYQEYDYIGAMINYDFIRSTLKLLTDKERKIVVLHIIEDKDFGYIGKNLGLSYKGVATSFYRAMTKLRTALARYEDEF